MNKPVAAVVDAASWAVAAATFAMLCASVAPVLSYAPFLVEREYKEIASYLDRAIASEVDRAWVDRELEAALSESPRDWESIDSIMEIAADARVEIHPDMAARVDEAREKDYRVGDCLRCAFDIECCPDLATLLKCWVPTELSPVGDVRALSRAFRAWKSEQPIDTLDAGLAFVGIAATVTGNLPGKAVAASIRTVSSAGILTKPFTNALRAQIDAINIKWKEIPGFLDGKHGWDRVVDSAAFSKFRSTVHNIRRLHIAAGSHIGGTLRLMRYADSPSDVARLAKITEHAGWERTVKAIKVLGKSRVLRVSLRLGKQAFGAIIWFVVLVGEIFGYLAVRIGTRMLRRRRPARAARARRSSSKRSGRRSP